jgi:hypothetical protein
MTKDAQNDDGPDFDAVMTAARRWYYSEVRSIADDAICLVCEDRPAPKYDEDERRAYLARWVDEITNGHEYVIYTAKAAMVLAASDCETAYEESMGETTGDVSTRACFAMRADIWQLLDARSDEWVPSEDEGAS